MPLSIFDRAKPDPIAQDSLFTFVMIKPTHYDDDGYPIQWFRSAIPSNTLAWMNALAEDARGRNVLGPDVEIRLHTYDETTRRVQPDRIIREIRKAGGKALIGLVGVQSNQFPRAVGLARPFLASGLPVCIGGFHISGCIAMLPEMPQDMREAQALGGRGCPYQCSFCTIINVQGRKSRFCSPDDLD